MSPSRRAGRAPSTASMAAAAANSTPVKMMTQASSARALAGDHAAHGGQRRRITGKLEEAHEPRQPHQRVAQRRASSSSRGRRPARRSASVASPRNRSARSGRRRVRQAAGARARPIGGQRTRWRRPRRKNGRAAAAPHRAAADVGDRLRDDGCNVAEHEHDHHPIDRARNRFAAAAVLENLVDPLTQGARAIVLAFHAASPACTP